MLCMVEEAGAQPLQELEQEQQQHDKQRQESLQSLPSPGPPQQLQAEQGQQQQQREHVPQLSPSAPQAAADVAAAPFRPAVQPAAGACAGAPSTARSGASGGCVAAVLEAVQSSTVARLLLSAAGPGAAGGAAGQLPRRLIMPQLEDLVNVPQLRFYLLGFDLDSPGLLDSIAAAEALGAAVHYKSQEQVLAALREDLGLPPDAAAGAASAGQLPAAAAAAAADAAAAGAAVVGTAAAAASEGVEPDGDVVDLTAPDVGDVFCQSVVLVPDHTSPQRLQQLLGPALPLWQLLACRVAFFAQSSCKGPLPWLRRKHRQLQQRQQQAGSAGSSVCVGSKRARGGATGGGAPQRRRVRQCSGGWQQQWAEEGELPGLEGDEDGGSAAIRLPAKLRQYQLFGNGVAVLMETTGLGSASRAQLQRLLALLARGQTQQEEQWGTLDGDGEWSLLVARRTLAEELSASRKAMLWPQLCEGRVLALDDVLLPETLADEAEVDNALLQNALSLAQQRAGALRLVVVLLPDIDLAVQQQQQQQAGRDVQSAGGVSIGCGGGGGTLSRDTSASEGCSGGAAATRLGATAAAGGGGSYMPGSGMTGDEAGMAAAQRAEQQRLTRIPRVLVRSLREQLERANAQGTILAGTMRQVLQLLEALVGGMQPGSTAGRQQQPC
ncbi:hypothetical protein COO60DRAFT_532989 [Scenedesmus sp. NREL 46B-D3]|nr:hypothetical protein COO60DRAFT_532989 [Scenedesmus sp. NREL 46B-D3]